MRRDIAATGAEVAAQLEVEQHHVSLLYETLDRMRAEAGHALKIAISSPTTATPGARSERDAFVQLYSSRVSQLQAVEERLCFGRMDTTDGLRRYIGRVGISDIDRTELLVDWRAPAAEPFYQATAAQPQDVVRRRQISTAARKVTALQDEVLNLEAFETVGVNGDAAVVGDGALFASLEAARSGRMRDIVATIQADQDRAIRAPLSGVFVIQGGPGTGKTAVALHRAAFLLYANREKISRSGVLVVGPNRVFLRYIEQVLPGLGESEAVLAVTPGDLFPGITADVEDAPAVAALKSDARMVSVLAHAVRLRQRLIERPRVLNVDGVRIKLHPEDVRRARDHARRSGKKHNQARAVFAKDVLNSLVRQLAEARGIELDGDGREALLAALHESVDVRREINLCWMPVTPYRLLRDLFADAAYRDRAARALRRDERAALQRPRTAPWTVSDVALLDEAAELLGVDDSSLHADRSEAIERAERRAEVEYARSVQDTFGGSDFITAEALAERYAQSDSLGSVAERAAADREWSFGHIVVDEAQELSPMMWRLLMRRCPSHSMTVVGDIAQTGALAGVSRWRDVFAPHVGERWNLSELTVNYRTPAQIMQLVSRVMAASPVEVNVPESARHGADDPIFTAVSAPVERSEALLEAVRQELEAVEEGTVVVITPRGIHDAVARLVGAGLGGAVSATSAEALDTQVSVLTVAEAKGLEFDSVVLVEPSQIVAESSRGHNDLYVAMTRPTKRLHVVHASELPLGMG